MKIEALAARPHPAHPAEPRRHKWTDAVALPAFRNLLASKRRFIAPLLAFYLTYFLGVMLLAGFARPLMSSKVFGPLSLGYVLIIGIYLMCWGLAVLYAYFAERIFDPQAARAVAEFEAEGRAP